MTRHDPPAPHCGTCAHYRHIANRCTLDRIEVYDLGYYCPQWQTNPQRKAPTNDHPT
jgi:hypothetical protein